MIVVEVSVLVMKVKIGIEMVAKVVRMMVVIINLYVEGGCWSECYFEC